MAALWASTLYAQDLSIPDAIRKAERSVVAVAGYIGTPEYPLPAQVDLFRIVCKKGPQEVLPRDVMCGIVVAVDQSANRLFVLAQAETVAPFGVDKNQQVEKRLLVGLAGKRTCPAMIHALDWETGLAILRVEGIPEDFENTSAMELGEAEKAIKGQEVLTFGSPWGLLRSGSVSVTKGMVSNQNQELSETLQPSGFNSVLENSNLYWSIDTRNESGISGGAIVDVQGKLIAVSLPATHRLFGEAGGVIALPLTQVIRTWIEKMIAGEEIEYGESGVFLEVVPVRNAPVVLRQFANQGELQVQGFSRVSPAYSGGVRVRDRILEINGSTVSGVADFRTSISLAPPGTVTEWTIYRPSNQSVQTVKVRVGKRGTNQPPPATVQSAVPLKWRGLNVGFPEILLSGPPMEIPSATSEGVRIQEVEAGSEAAKAGLTAGQFILRVGELPVASPSEFHDALKYWPGSTPLRMDDGREVFVNAAP
ncbi:trypsin-like peptidase domain-containing protein [Planctomicrobium sp. SH668]|uniref:trypsin-like peptidase domain-containing protein n=1 Tax=Planctomicrobium sp. SH668 TaxID=3448126 RepID=UPI003F5C5085